MLALIMSISVVLDVAENLDRFFTQNATLNEIIFDYYLNFVLFYGNQFSGFIAFLAVILLTSKMSRDTEIVPILAGGISYARFMRPFLIGASAIVLVSLMMNHYIVPNGNAKRLIFEEKYNSKKFNLSNIKQEITPGESVYFRSFYESNGYIDQFWLTHRDKSTGKLNKMFYASRAIGDSSSRKWRFQGAFERDFANADSLNHDFKMIPILDTLMGYTLADFTATRELAMTMSTPRLLEYIEEQKKSGSANISFYELKLHERSSYPLITFVLTVLGVSISSRKSRNGVGINLVFGLLVVLFYVFGIQFTTVGALNAGFNPFWAVWAPNLFFLGCALFFYSRAPK